MPDMKTALTTALTGTGLKPKTQTERIWNWLKDHPDQPTKRIQLELKLTKNSVSSLLSQMVKRKMLSVKQVTDRLGTRSVFRVSEKMREFELLPKPKATETNRQIEVSQPVCAKKAETAPNATPNTVVELPVQMHCAEEQLPQSSTELVDSLTVAKARELYNILHKLFGQGK